MAIVYTCFCTDVIHEGHLNIIRQAKKYGDLIVGVLCDSEMVRYNRFPTVSLESRIKMLEEIPEVSKVVVQNHIMYDEIISEIKPDYVIHGDNWHDEPLSAIRKNVIDVLSKQNQTGGGAGKLIEIPYTYNDRVKKIDESIMEKLAMPEFRRSRLKRLLKMIPLIKVIEVHSGITGLIAEKTVISHDGGLDQFDAMWSSSLCDSTSKGKPDIELIDLSSRIRTIEEIMDVTTKPIILDIDTGGLIEHFVYHVRTLERIGVSAIIVEDKTGLKRNSLLGTDVEQTQDTVENFCLKIKMGKEAQRTEDFMVIARIESLILDKGINDAITRAKAYVDAGADGIMIHSRKSDPDEVFTFCGEFRKMFSNVPLVVVPTSFSQVTENELMAHGINIVIYANQLMRSSFLAMRNTAETILKNHRAKETEPYLLPVKEIISMIDMV